MDPRPQNQDESTERALLEIVAHHRRRIEQSPEVGMLQQYALGCLTDIENDLRAALSGGSAPDTLRHVRHAILAWPHAEAMNSVEMWEALARHITDWVDNRKELPDHRRPRRAALSGGSPPGGPSPLDAPPAPTPNNDDPVQHVAEAEKFGYSPDPWAAEIVRLRASGADLLEAARRVLDQEPLITGALRVNGTPGIAKEYAATIGKLRDAVARYDGSRQEEAT